MYVCFPRTVGALKVSAREAPPPPEEDEEEDKTGSCRRLRFLLRRKKTFVVCLAKLLFCQSLRNNMFPAASCIVHTGALRASSAISVTFRHLGLRRL